MGCMQFGNDKISPIRPKDESAAVVIKRNDKNPPIRPKDELAEVIIKRNHKNIIIYFIYTIKKGRGLRVAD